MSTTRTTAKPKPRAVSVALPPVGAKCQEASQHSHTAYVPCEKPAVRLIWEKDQDQRAGATKTAYAMCVGCADHSVKNRGMQLVEQGAKYTLAKMPQPTSAEVLANLKEVNKAAATPNTTDPALLVDVESNPEEPTDEQRRQVTAAAKQAMQLEDEIAALQAQISDKSTALARILGAELPASMKIVGQTEVPLIGGAKVQLKDILQASILLANKNAAHRWLELPEVGGAPLVKRQFVIEFGMGDEKWAAKFERDMAQRKKPLNVERKETVHPGSLTKFVKEKKAAGKDIDTSINIYEATVAEIKRPKASKPTEGM